MGNKLKNVCMCRVRATKEAPWQTGIAVCETPGIADVRFIVTLDGKVLPDVYDYYLNYHEGSFNIIGD